MSPDQSPERSAVPFCFGVIVGLIAMVALGVAHTLAHEHVRVQLRSGGFASCWIYAGGGR